MGKFSVRLNDASEKTLSEIMEGHKKNSKNGGIEYAIMNLSRMEKELSEANESLAKLREEYNILYQILSSFNQVTTDISKLFSKKKKSH